MNQQPEPQMNPPMSGGGGDDTRPMRRRYVKKATIPRPMAWCCCLIFVGLIIALVAVIVHNQPSQPPSLSTIHSESNVKNFAKPLPFSVSTKKSAAVKVNTALRFAKHKRNEDSKPTHTDDNAPKEDSEKKNKLKPVDTSILPKNDAAAIEIATDAGTQTQEKKKDKNTPHHFYHDVKKHGNKN